MKPTIVLLACALSACTTMGPMPATTGIAAVPIGRPGVEVQAGVVPGYMLSEATQQAPGDGGASEQLLALVEPDRWLGTRGLIAGAREVGRENDFAFEPFLGYRHRIDEHFAVALVGFGTSSGRDDGQASYHASRGGAELAADARIAAPLPWLALHGQVSGSATYLSARGTYCADDAGFGVDCGTAGNGGDASTDRVVDGRVSGMFVAGTAALALDLGRSPVGAFHGARVALLGAAGTMPRLRDGMATDSARYVSLGLTLTLGAGER